MTEKNAKYKAVMQLIIENGLDGIVVYSKGTSSIIEPNYFQFFSGFCPMGPRNAAIISRTGEVILLLDSPWDFRMAFEKSWIHDVKETMNFNNDLISILNHLKIGKSVGLVGSNQMIDELYSRISMHAEVLNIDEGFDRIGIHKTTEEVKRIKELGRIAESGFEALFESARNGIREYELVAEMEFEMRLAGADDVFILISSGNHNYAMHEPTDRRLKRGDVVIGEITTPAFNNAE